MAIAAFGARATGQRRGGSFIWSKNFMPLPEYLGPLTKNMPKSRGPLGWIGVDLRDRLGRPCAKDHRHRRTPLIALFFFL
jgi:hypothetical protein